MAYIKNPSVKVFIKKNLPPALGGYKFYDKDLKKLACVSPHKAWTVLHQQFIDDFINKGSKRKWTGVPFLNPWDCPCTPGSVILVREMTINKFLRRIPPHAYIAGLVTDFYSPGPGFVCMVERVNGYYRKEGKMPLTNVVLITGFEKVGNTHGKLNWYERPVNALVPVQEKPVRTAGSGEEFRKVYQSKNTEAAVIITASGVSVSSVEHLLKAGPTFLDLNNFDDTGLEPTSCYVITRVLTVDRLRIEVTLNGDVFYEHTFTVGVPICFHASKVQVDEDEQGLLKDMRPMKKSLPVQIMKKRNIQHFLHPFLPNQMKLGNAVGDAPAVFNWQEPEPERSFRPNFLPRPERSHQTDVIFYFKSDTELIDLYMYRANGRRQNPTTTPSRPSCHHGNRTVNPQPLPVTEHAVDNQPFDEAHDVEDVDGTSSITTTNTCKSTTSTRGESSYVTSDDTSDDEESSEDETTSDDTGFDSMTTEKQMINQAS